MREITINQNDAGQRLDKFLTKYLVNMPQSMLYKSLRKNCVRVNGKHIKDGKYMLQNGDVLKLFFKDEFYESKSSFKAGNSDIDVVYEDENIILINKESGVVVHSDDKGTKDTLLERMQSYLYKKGEYNPENEHSFSPSFCNRLDRNTSGIIIGAKNAAALRIINEKSAVAKLKKYIFALSKVILKKAVTLPHILHAVTKKLRFQIIMKKIQRKSAQNIMLLPKKKTLHLLKSSLKQDAHTKSEHSFRI